jgi:two-component system KDP operon response regulator KdpE
LTINFGKRLVYLKGEELHTTPLEYALLSFLFKNIGRVVTTKSLLQELYGISHNDDTQALRALMAGLRRKIERNPATPRYILTEIGVGYRLVDE